MRSKWILFLFFLLHIVIYLVIFQGLFPDRQARPPGNTEDSMIPSSWEGLYAEYHDFAEADSRSLYFYYADRIFNGDLPYQDFEIEYAPLSLPLFLFPRLFAESDISYHIWFAVEMLLFDLAGLLLVYSLAKQLRLSTWKTLAGCTIVLLGIGPLIIDHFDLPATIVVLGAVYAFIRKRYTISWILLGIGTMIRIFPIIIAPLLMLYLIRNRDYHHLFKGCITLGATLLLISIPCLLSDATGFIDSFTYHSDRGIQIESTYASALLLADSWDIVSINTGFVENSGSWEITNSWTGTFARLIPIFMVLSLIFIYGLFYHRYRPEDPQIPDNNHLITFSILIITVFLFTNKVFSPQYIIWLYPLLLASAFRQSVLCLLFAIVGLLTHYLFAYHIDYVFSDHYLSLAQHKNITEVWVLAIRNLLVFILVMILMRPHFLLRFHISFRR